MINQNWKIGDCKNFMKEMKPNSVDLGLTDPPYGYGFMGKDWDRAVPTVDLWKEFYRVLKPGAFAFIMSAPRQDVLAHNLVNLSDAGFDTSFTSIYWTYASGFPKASNIGKMIDKRLGAEREVVGKSNALKGRKSDNHETYGQHIGNSEINKYEDGYPITTPATSQAKELNGSYGGFQPKPAVEVIMVVMKPLSEKTYVDQAMTNQKGITWLDDGRIPFNSDNESNIRLNAKNHKTNKSAGIECFNKIGDNERDITKDRSNLTQDLGLHNFKGRFPANLLVCDDVLNDGKITKPHKTHFAKSDIEYKKPINDANGYNSHSMSVNKQIAPLSIGDSGSFSRYFDLDVWWSNQIKHLPKEIKKTFPFIITPKASKKEKMGSTHSTIKPLKLFTYLMTIGSRPDDLVLDPFLGSGTTLQSGRLLDRSVIGYELDPQWETGYNSRVMKNIPSLLSFW